VRGTLLLEILNCRIESGIDGVGWFWLRLTEGKIGRSVLELFLYRLGRKASGAAAPLTRIQLSVFFLCDDMTDGGAFWGEWIRYRWACPGRNIP